jgi:hypothetical protein
MASDPVVRSMLIAALRSRRGRKLIACSNSELRMSLRQALPWSVSRSLSNSTIDAALNSLIYRRVIRRSRLLPDGISSETVIVIRLA